jgi:Lrp/AsnC family transcriptional regulator, regulator for asnA, asnC and gidA
MANPIHPNSFDRLDFLIIQELQQDGRADAAKIARAVNAKERTVRKRIARLIEVEAISLTAIVNPKIFGYAYTVDIFLNVVPEHEADVIERLLAMPEIAHIAYGLGDQDVFIQAHFKENDELRKFLRRVLPAIPGVRVTNVILVPRILRNTNQWLPKPEDFGPRAGEEDGISS